VLPAKNRPLPIYAAAGCIFAALAVRNFALPLRVQDLGGDKVAIGLLFSVGTVTAAGLSLPAGFLGDRLGKRTLLVLSVAIGAVSQLGLGLTSTVPPLYVWQALGGVGGAAAQAALMAALVDVVPASSLGRAMGWLTLGYQVGFLAGPALAGLTLRWIDLSTALTASTALLGLAGLMALTVPAAPGRPVGWDVVGPLREVARQRGFAVATVGMLGATLLWGTLQAYLPVFGREHLRLAPEQIGYLIALQAVANGLARIPGGRIVDRLPNRSLVVTVGVGIYAASIALLPHLSGFWATTLLLTLSVPFLATSYVALGVAFSDLSTERTRGVAMGLYGVFLFLGLGFGPAIFGTVIESSGYVAGFTACAAAGLLMAALTAALRGRQRLSEREPAPA
jgi:MFS family permease